MKTSYTLLRVLILAGCLPLLARYARVVPVRAFTQDCTNFSGPTTKNCPSGCTSPTYTDYPLIGGLGFRGANQNPTPCSPSGCTQPYAFSAPQWMCGACCLDAGYSCDPHKCDNGDPCCGHCNPLSGKCCSEASQLCYSNFDCCGDLTCSSGHLCCGGRAHTCEVCSDCCDPYSCVNGFCRFIL
jgi:hypothetical protein